MLPRRPSNLGPDITHARHGEMRRLAELANGASPEEAELEGSVALASSADMVPPGGKRKKGRKAKGHRFLKVEDEAEDDLVFL